MKITLPRFVTGAAAAAGIGLLGALAPALATPEPPHPTTTTVEPTTAATEPTTSIAVTEPPTSPATEPSSTEPKSTEPKSTEPPTTAPAPTEPPTTEAHHESTPPTSGDAHPGDQTPSTLVLNCSISDGRNVTCSWSGEVPATAVRLLFLRGELGGKGRVMGEFDTNVQSATDANVPVGTFSYVVVLLNAEGKVVAHSQGVPIS